jgi:hypothetical protein
MMDLIAERKLICATRARERCPVTLHFGKPHAVDGIG